MCCAHTSCSSLSKVTQKAETHVYTQAQVEKTGSNTHKLQTIWCVQINFRLFCTVFPTQFTSPPQPYWCLPLQLSLSLCRWPIQWPDPPMSPLSRWVSKIQQLL